MIESKVPPPPSTSIADDELLENGEVLVIVDDFADIVSLIKEFLQLSGFPAISAGSAEELRHCLATNTWPGYADDRIVDGQLPGWYLNQIDEEY